MFKLSYSGIGTNNLNATIQNFVTPLGSNCSIINVYNFPATVGVYQNSTVVSGRIFSDVFVKIGNIVNQQTLPYIEWTAAIPTDWFAATTMAELRIAEMNNHSIGQIPL